MAQLSSSRQPRYSTGRSRRTTARGRRARAAGPTPVRRRGPAPILIILGVIVAIISCYILGKGCGGNQEAKENDKLRAYASAVNKLIERSGAVAVQFDNVRNGVKELTREDIARKLSQMAADSADIAKEAEKVEVPSKATTLEPLLQLSLDLRASGVSKFRAGLLDMLDKKDTQTAAATMSQGLVDLVVSDEAFQRYRTRLETQLKSAKSGDLGYVQVANSAPYVPKKEDALLSGVTAYIGELGGEETGDEIHGVAVKGLSTSPASEDSTESGVVILPFSKSFTVTVAVENQGNQEEENIPVVVNLVLETESSPQQKTKKITRLKANETTSLVFDGLKPATGRDKVNVLKVKTGPVDKERNTGNNEKEYRFIMLPEGG